MKCNEPRLFAKPFISHRIGLKIAILFPLQVIKPFLTKRFELVQKGNAAKPSRGGVVSVFEKFQDKSLIFRDKNKALVPTVEVVIRLIQGGVRGFDFMRDCSFELYSASGESICFFVTKMLERIE